MKAMILAAGLGTRMLPLTSHTPKPLLRVAGKPLIEHHLLALHDAGITDIVINVSHLGQQIIDYLQTGQAYGLNISYSEEESPLETAGGIQNALPLLGEQPFLLVNGDLFTDYPFANLVNKYRVHANGAHLVLVANPHHNPDGDFALAGQQVTAREIEGPALTFSGISVFHPDVFQHRERLSKMRPLLDGLIAHQQLTGEQYLGIWHDVGTPESLAKLNEEQSSQ